jgi:hypothetical protein
MLWLNKFLMEVYHFQQKKIVQHGDYGTVRAVRNRDS